MENWLAAKAQEYEAKAHRARLDAQRIQGELAQLKSCLVPVKNLHNLKTWESTAASKSRQLLNGHRSYYLNSIVGRLHQLIEKLNTYAYIWAQNAENFWRLSRIEAAS